MKKNRILFATAFLFFALASCKKQNQTPAQNSPAPAPEKKVTIGFSIDTLADRKSVV